MGKRYEMVTVGRWTGPVHRARAEMQVGSGTPSGSPRATPLIPRVICLGTEGQGLGLGGTDSAHSNSVALEAAPQLCSLGLVP